MGEIILSLVIGGCLALAGIILIVVVGREEKTIDDNDKKAKQ